MAWIVGNLTIALGRCWIAISLTGELDILLALKPVVVIGEEELWKDGNKTGATGATGIIEDDTAGCFSVGVGILTGGARPVGFEIPWDTKLAVSWLTTEPEEANWIPVGEAIIFVAIDWLFPAEEESWLICAW